MLQRQNAIAPNLMLPAAQLGVVAGSAAQGAAAARAAPAQPAARALQNGAQLDVAGSGVPAGNGEQMELETLAGRREREEGIPPVEQVSISASEWLEMRRIRVESGKCTRAQAVEWGMLDLFPKQHTNWIKSDHMFEVIDKEANEFGPCKFCGKEVQEVLNTNGFAGLVKCEHPEAAIAAKKREDYSKSKNTSWAGTKQAFRGARY